MKLTNTELISTINNNKWVRPFFKISEADILKVQRTRKGYIVTVANGMPDHGRYDTDKWFVDIKDDNIVKVDCKPNMGLYIRPETWEEKKKRLANTRA